MHRMWFGFTGIMPRRFVYVRVSVSDKGRHKVIQPIRAYVRVRNRRIYGTIIDSKFIEARA